MNHQKTCSLGKHWLQVIADYAGQSFRLMAVAVGMLKGVGPSELRAMSQQQAEACCSHMHFLGLVVLSNQLHPASVNTIRELQERCARLVQNLILHCFASTVTTPCSLKGLSQRCLHRRFCPFLETFQSCRRVLSFFLGLSLGQLPQTMRLVQSSERQAQTLCMLASTTCAISS